MKWIAHVRDNWSLQGHKLFVRRNDQKHRCKRSGAEGEGGAEREGGGGERRGRVYVRENGEKRGSGLRKLQSGKRRASRGNELGDISSISGKVDASLKSSTTESV